MKKVISTANAPAAIGPYSQGIGLEKLVFISGQTPLCPESGLVVEGGIEEQTRRCLDNVKGVVEAAGGSMGSIVKTTVFLQDMNDFAAMNAVYASYFKSNPPARSTVEVARLPKDAMVEIEAIASL